MDVKTDFTDTDIRLRKLLKIVERTFAQVETDGIGRSQFRVVFPIMRDGTGYSIQELADLLGVDKSFVSREISKLETMGIIRRDREAGSRERNYKIVLTEEGKVALERRKVTMESLRKVLLNGVTMEEMVVFKDILDRLTDDTVIANIGSASETDDVI